MVDSESIPYCSASFSSEQFQHNTFRRKHSDPEDQMCFPSQSRSSLDGCRSIADKLLSQFFQKLVDVDLDLGVLDKKASSRIANCTSVVIQIPHEKAS